MTERLGIGEFARQVGITPSALRFYDDCGVLRPAEVDDGNGYRYYSADQRERAELLRDLRETDLPLADVRVVLDSVDPLGGRCGRGSAGDSFCWSPRSAGRR